MRGVANSGHPMMVDAGWGRTRVRETPSPLCPAMYDRAVKPYPHSAVLGVLVASTVRYGLWNGPELDRRVGPLTTPLAAPALPRCFARTAQPRGKWNFCRFFLPQNPQKGAPLKVGDTICSPSSLGESMAAPLPSSLFPAVFRFPTPNGWPHAKSPAEAPIERVGPLPVR
jgi:hypothetical protein